MHIIVLIALCMSATSIFGVVLLDMRLRSVADFIDLRLAKLQRQIDDKINRKDF